MTPSLPFDFSSTNQIPSSIQGYISVQGQGSVFSNSSRELPRSTQDFQADIQTRNTVRSDLEQSGFTILAESPLGFAVEAPPEAYEELSGGKIELRERLLNTEFNQVRYVTHIDIVGEEQPDVLGVAFAKSKTAQIDGILIQRPRLRLGVFPSPIAPNPSRFHLRVPNDVALGLGALQAHRQGFRGEGVTIAMPDSGQYQHPFFIAHGYTVKPTITVVEGTDPSKDPVGHGTGESANIFSVAPDAVLQAIRASDDEGNLVGAISGFMRAKELNPQIITCSWGGDQLFPPSGPPDEFDQFWALEILNAIEQDIFVVFSAGNGSFTIEPQVPGVLAAGGTYMSQDLSLEASNYTSGYESPWFSNVTVPTVSGLVGNLPRAQYIMLPVQPGCIIDIGSSQPSVDDPNDDETQSNDGWALFSGTSAAAPQIAGVAALILSAKPGLKPSQITEAIVNTSIDVTNGTNHPRFSLPATVGQDPATGHGLVNASAAVQYAIDNF